MAELDAVRGGWANNYNATADDEGIVGRYVASTYEANYGIVQLGFFTVIPYFLELWLEISFSHALFECLRLITMGSWVFFIFASQTKGFRLAEAIRHGKAGYVATGRGYVIEPGSFIALYAVYAKSHIYTGFEILCLLSCYHFFAGAGVELWGAVAMLWLFAFSLLFAPYLFNPQSLSTNTIAASFEELVQWFKGDADPTSKDHHGSWRKWHANRLAMVRGSSLFLKLQDHLRILILRMMLLLPVCAHLKVKEDSLPSSRILLVLLAGGLMCAAQLLVYLFASDRTLCRLAVLGLDGASRALGGAYRLVVVVAVASAGCFLMFELSRDHIAFDWTEAGRSNAALLAFAAVLISTYVLQLLVTLQPPPKSADAATGSGQMRPLALFRAGLIAYADSWYFLMDVIITGCLIFTLSVLSLFPLLRLQSMTLFNRDFAKVISKKLSRAELLKRILS